MSINHIICISKSHLKLNVWLKTHEVRHEISSFCGGELENHSGLRRDAIESGRWAPLFWKACWLLGRSRQFRRWRRRQSVVPTDVPKLPDHPVFDHRTPTTPSQLHVSYCTPFLHSKLLVAFQEPVSAASVFVSSTSDTAHFHSTVAYLSLPGCLIIVPWDAPLQSFNFWFKHLALHLRGYKERSGLRLTSFVTLLYFQYVLLIVFGHVITSVWCNWRIFIICKLKDIQCFLHKKFPGAKFFLCMQLDFWNLPNLPKEC